MSLILGALLVGLTASAATAQLAFDEVVVTAGPARSAGAFTDYFIDPVVVGTGIYRVLLSSEFGTLSNVEMVEVTPGEFVCDDEIPSEPCENFASLAAISALGDLSFDVEGDLGELDSITIPIADYDPGSGQAGFPDVLFPNNWQTGVSTSATLQWSAPPSWVDAIAVSLEERFTGLFGDDMVFIGAPPGTPVTTSSWSPAGMTNGTVYDFDLSLFELIVFEDDRTSDGGRGYVFTSGFESFNRIAFSVPEPAVSASLAAGLTMLASLARPRRRAG
ncbi:MAG: hypothetical protein CL908_19680 [Deltaproteobacteria bacterium]|jgi:hypothetical protein|nr:hypothetical protein [Deltaproteobacteria bacterium]